MELKNLQFSDIENLFKKLNKKETSWFKKYIIPIPQSIGPIEKLNKISKKCQEIGKLINKNNESIQNYPFFNDLYHIAIHPKMLLRAYLNVLKDKKIRVIDKNYSVEKIIDLHQSLKESTYMPQPFVKVWITKTQPLEMEKSLVVSTFDDSIVQESIRLILAKIYEPLFQIYKNLYGFRRQNQSSVREAIKKFNRYSWNSHYVIKGNLKDIFIHKKKLLSVLERNIQDKKLMNLIEKFLKAKNWGEKKFQAEGAYCSFAKIVAPAQGCSLMNLLFNIYMQQFDLFIETEVQQFINTINNKQKRIPLQGTQVHRIVYIRYVEDWIVIILGTRGLTQLIKNKIQTFLKTQFELQLFPEKIFIANIQKNWIYFLGFAIQVQKKEKHSDFCQTHVIIKIDRERLAFQLKSKGFLHEKKNKSIHKFSWAVLPDFQIVQRYRQIIRKIYYYYKDVVNRDNELNWAYHILRTSCAKTLAAKYKLRTMTKVFKKYGPNLKVKNTEKNIYITFPTLKQLQMN